MRHDVSRLIRKTETRFHRNSDKRVVSIPKSTYPERMTALKIFGNYSLGDDYSISGVGDYDEASGKYKIPLRIHGKNYISGEDYVEAHRTAGVTIDAQVIGDEYFVLYDHTKNGTVFLDSSEIRFKENTVYSFCARFHYNISTKYDQNAGICFNYSDGTSSQMRMITTESDFTYCIPSEEGKTVVSIASDANYYLFNKLYISSIGIFEGNNGDYESVFESFDGTTSEIIMEKPLLRLYNTVDELDILSGKIKRKIRSLRLGEGLIIEDMRDSGVLKIKLDLKMRPNSNFIASYEYRYDFADLFSYTRGVMADENGEYIYIMDNDNFHDIESFISYSAANPIYFNYILAESENEDISFSLPIRNGDTVIELMCDMEPRKFYAEYF